MNTRNFDMEQLRVAEISHRMSNGFQLLQSYTRRQITECCDDEARHRLSNVLEQIRSVASQTNALAQADTGDLGAFLDAIEPHWDRLGAADAIDVLVDRHQLVRMDPRISENAARILLEAMTNCLEHAFPDRDRGHIVIKAEMLDDQHCRLRVEDDGVGLRRAEAWSFRGSGTRIVKSLASEIGGRTSWQDRGGGGTMLVVEFPVNLPTSVATLKDANG